MRSEVTVAASLACGLDPEVVHRVVATALAEDLGPDRLDVTSAATIDPGQLGTAELVARSAGVVAGLPLVAAVFAAVPSPTADPAGSVGGAGSADGAGSAGPVEVRLHRADGDRVPAGTVLATLTGPVRTLLTGERTALNLISRLSGVATHTRAWTDALAGSKATVLDTRKTTPGLRLLEKYAVRVGGGGNKRMGLYDVAMVKDNHKLAAGGVGAAYRRVREAFPGVPVEVEVTTLAEAVEAVEAGATFLLCDNMPAELLSAVVAEVGDRVEVEATGGLTLANAARYARTGVDYLSVGALTHSSPIMDIALDLRPAGVSASAGADRPAG
ncbi:MULTISPECIES: carboxylating nicotinate-nucleotide diphosphorylase [unclassified Solwaraspora]|uniref:carboxylating nicotinate-nucleotide diphosphorylase n=1 Tax=unclassified Solwaraspora TaxID=2627926 RepID=UPI00248B6D5A|nr:MULTISPECIES: carboxylating nicotinate-nucleotide diphosphorylase [unclassified Solwaraspora]WBB97354.1 carboxylating nicotinate-nucleotide diphosphorylase [Solwaraspora sp. WMMA2059]WBC18744.1 carboxylating nicotinate-nucleotide diphosphorylase [Solwaraspora sp. WMMA2080]WJK33850.1 carboxylating nicotinate-nucleotide diphosphorylase [Solwaraspora sp. WMMA2065]